VPLVRAAESSNVWPTEGALVICLQLFKDIFGRSTSLASGIQRDKQIAQPMQSFSLNLNSFCHSSGKS
jgi:hypothetical protein